MIKLTYEVWPEPKFGVQGDPIRRTAHVQTLHAAFSEANRLKTVHGENLRFIDITQRIVGQ